VSYKIIEHTDSFSVFHAQPLQVEKTELQPDGTYLTTTVPYTQEFRISSDPSVFDAWYEGNGDWTCDINCGLQRWRGRKSVKDVKQALRKCKFDKKTISALLARQTAERDGEKIR
jgi:hypothetical protein